MKKIFLILLVCCLLLFTTAYAEPAITIRSIAGNGTISDNSIEISELPQNIASSDLKNIMQISTNPGYPEIEIYHDYSPTNLKIPWYDYIRIENGFTVHGNYLSRHVWVTPTNTTKVQEIIDSNEISEWDEEYYHDL